MTKLLLVALLGLSIILAAGISVLSVVIWARWRNIPIPDFKKTWVGYLRMGIPLAIIIFILSLMFTDFMFYTKHF